MNLIIINLNFTDLKGYCLLTALGHPESIHRADIRLSDISNLLGADWVHLASELGISTSDVNLIKTEYPHNINQQAVVMLQLWQHTAGNKVTGKIMLPLSVEVTVAHEFVQLFPQYHLSFCIFSLRLILVLQSPRVFIRLELRLRLGQRR
jgi:hypothetical protein